MLDDYSMTLDAREAEEDKALYERELPDNEWEDAETFIHGEIAQLQLSTQTEFHVTSESSADWVVARMQAWQHELESREAAFLAEKKRLTRNIEYFKARFTAELSELANQQIAMKNARGGKEVKSYKLPCGAKIGYRISKAAIQIIDEDAYNRYVMTHHPECFDLVPKIDKRALHPLLLEAGEIPEGAQFKPEENNFYISI